MKFQKFLKRMLSRLKPSPQPTPGIVPPMFLSSQLPTLYKDQPTDAIQTATKDLQCRLKARGFEVEETGVFDVHTHDAVCQFQAQQGLAVDGIVSCLTWAALRHPTLKRGDGASPESQLQTKEEDVKFLQRCLFDEGFPNSDPIGQFGAATETAVRKFQRCYGLGVDGIVGPMTWAIVIGLLQRMPGKRMPGKRMPGRNIFIPRNTLIGWLNEFTLVASVVLGIQFSVLSAPSPLRIHDIVTALALSWLVPWIFKPFLPTQLAVSRSLLTRLGPYFLTGVLWRQVFDSVCALIEKYAG